MTNNRTTRFGFALAALLIAGLTGAVLTVQPTVSAGPDAQQEAKLRIAKTGSHRAGRPAVHHKTVKIDGLDIFYREAGSKEAPTVLLLHGFPT